MTRFQRFSRIGLRALASFAFLTSLHSLAADMPYLSDSTPAQLMVDGKPFIMLGGELGNSSSADTRYLQTLWPKLAQMHLNTVLAPVYWDLIEPQPGRFDFTLVDDLLATARQHQTKLVLLWFGSWKNSMSTYTPSWVKRAAAQFPLARDRNGKQQKILTPFSDNNLQADIRAYSALLNHLKKVDTKQRTVLMMQVENEIGMLPDARDYHPAATAAFHAPVPSELMDYLSAHKAQLAPELAARWAANGNKTSGNWEAIFGQSLATDELFMAWYFARYSQAVAAAGKAIYPLPTYVNAALNRPGIEPGKYPSAGPLPHVIDLWKAGAPAIDLFSPDFYNPDFKYWNDRYTRLGETLFIPEIHAEPDNAAKVFFALGHYRAIGFSPFSIESTETPEHEPIGMAYGVLKPLLPMIASASAAGKIDGALVDKANPVSQFTLGDFVFTVKHDYTLGWSPAAKDEVWPQGGVLVIQTGAENFWVSGTSVVITVASANPGLQAGLDYIYEGQFSAKGPWQRGRNLNGDQNHQGRHLRIPALETGTQEVRLYTHPQ
jgi:beta-galactosidase GanA